jgi:hypothetical protein
MAKKVLSEYYTFNPSTKTITIPNKIIPRENLLLVVNSTSNTVLFNFSDPDIGISSYTYPYNTTGTQFVLNYNTTAMSTSDPLMIMTDEPNTEIDFSETAQDATNKLRIAQPQSLIDTDFEYGLQGIKWESYATVNNYPSFYYKSGGNSLNVASIASSSQVSRSAIFVTTVGSHNLTTGDMITVGGTTDPSADGTFQINLVPNATSFAYSSKATIATGTISTPYSSVAPTQRIDSNNQSSNLTLATSNAIISDNATTSTLTFTFANNHGLLAGAPIQLMGFPTPTAALVINGNWKVYDCPSMNTFRIQTSGLATGVTAFAGLTSTATSVGAVYVNPEVYFQHRAQDGGVLVSTGTIQEGISAVRQTRRYFRYQSGKGIQMSSGTKFTPTLDINSISSVGTAVTVTIQQPLTFNTGVSIVIDGVQTNGGATNYYNGTFTVQSINYTNKSFVYFTTSNNVDTSPGGVPFATIKNFAGAAIRVGMFDAQNGFYMEYDGLYVYAVKRDSVKELYGLVNVTNGSSIVTGVGTKFSKQINGGDFVVIRGASYQVASVDTDTTLTIAPRYRGATTTGARINLTVNTRVVQSDWSLDRCDGYGKSGFVLDMAKMQMVYMDYTWYGAGTIRYGFRATNGEVIYCHKTPNNNRNYAAYMRSGNLPARYEVYNVGPYARMISGNVASRGVSLASGDSQMVVSDAQYWPASGQITVTQSTNGGLTGNQEVMSYSSKFANTAYSGWVLDGLSRRQLGGTTSNVTYTVAEFDGGAAGVSAVTTVTYTGTNLAPVVSHWGTSVIMDGGYNEDRSIVFSFAKPANLNISANSTVAAISIRLAPSVDNSIVGAFGAREVVNRMQLKLLNIDTNATGPLQISGILNPSSYTSTVGSLSAGQWGIPQLPNDWATTSVVSLIGSASLAQIIDHVSSSTGVTIATGGEQIFSFLADVGVNAYNLGDVRDLGNCILGGDGSNRTPGFPNGPDVLVLTVRNVNSSATVSLRSLRISWTEAQA